MTTAHKSQLEARNGGKNNVKTNIKHSRLLPSHQNLKLRNVPEKILVKQDQESGASGHGSQISLDKNEVDLVNKLIQETEPTSLEDKVDQDDEDDEDDDDDDEEDLERELELLKAAAAATKIPTEQEQETPSTKASSWRTKSAFNKRSNKVQKPEESTRKKQYSTTVTKNQYHQDFLKKFIR